MSRKNFEIIEETRAFTSPRTNVVRIKKELSGCASVLDVGCGAKSPLRFLDCERLVGIDAYEPDLQRGRENRTHDEFVSASGTDLRSQFSDDSFDACAAIDVIEHLTKSDGLQFLKDLEAIATRKVMIFTPNGFLPQQSKEDGDLQEHLSGWDPQEMRDLGYEVVGLDGLKGLRADHHRLRFRPYPFWAAVSWFSQELWCESHPESAAAILAIKTLA